MPARLALGVLCVAMNLWKTEKEIDTIHQSVEQRLPDFLRSKVPELPVSARLKVVREFTFRTPAVRDGKIVGTEIYDGPVISMSACCVGVAGMRKWSVAATPTAQDRLSSDAARLFARHIGGSVG